MGPLTEPRAETVATRTPSSHRTPAGPKPATTNLESAFPTSNLKLTCPRPAVAAKSELESVSRDGLLNSYYAQVFVRSQLSLRLSAPRIFVQQSLPQSGWSGVSCAHRPSAHSCASSVWSGVSCPEGLKLTIPWSSGRNWNGLGSQLYEPSTQLTISRSGVSGLESAFSHRDRSSPYLQLLPRLESAFPHHVSSSQSPASSGIRTGIS